MKRLPALAGALILLFPAAYAGAQTYHPNTAEQRLVNQIVYHRNMTWHWQDRAHHRRVSTEHRESIATMPLLARLKHYWEHRHYVAWRSYKRYEARNPVVPSWFVSQALCIHSHEGSWTDTGDPFWGGMQFMLSTWVNAGGTGLPSAASPSEQIYRAYVVWKKDGGSWREWPNTARMCGLY